MKTRRHTPVADAVSGPLTALVTGLRDLGIEPHADELADALWLARWVPAVRPEGAPEPGGLPCETADEDSGPPEPAPAGADDTAPRGTPLPTAPAAELTVPTPGEGAAGPGAGTVRVPTASALPEPLALQRALRPLRRYRSPTRPVRTQLDERLTAERAADTRIVVPVLCGTRRREARLQLVMDASTSTVVWGETLQELRQICERAGAFREVRVHHVREGDDGEARIALSDAPDAVRCRPEELRDPTGHQLTLVLSDCAGPLWRGGQMQRLLHSWAATAPVAVVQPLPQRMWRRTHLPAVPGELVRREGPAGRLAFLPGRGGSPADGALPVPVIAPRPGPLRAWVRLVSGATGQSLYTVAGWVRPDHPESTAARRTDREVSPRDRVRAFRRTASPDAARLAVYLSATPLVLPVMQLVQRAMLADSGPEVLAEVVLGGLLRQSGDFDGLPGYEFVDGVRQELLAQIAVSDVQLVLKHCSQYVESRYGRTARNFPALAAGYLAGEAQAQPGTEGATEDHGLRAFARVSAEVLRRFGHAPVPGRGPGNPAGDADPGALALRAQNVLLRYHREHSARDLDEAIVLLKAAIEGQRATAERQALQGELGGALLSRWNARRTVQDLRSAHEAFRQADVDSPHLLLLWATALMAIAAEVDNNGLGTEALPDHFGERAAGERSAEAALMDLYTEAERCVVVVRDREPEGLGEAGYRILNHLLGTSAQWASRPAFAQLLTEYGGAGPWAAERLEGALEAAQAWQSHEEETERLTHRAQLRLDLAKHYAGRGPVDWDPDEEQRAQGYRHAADAVTGLRQVIDRLSRLKAAPAGALCDAWIDLATALRLTREGATDSALEERLSALRRALHLAGDDYIRCNRCYQDLGLVLDEKFVRTGDRAFLDEEVAVWRAMLSRLSPDDSFRAQALRMLGHALLQAEEWDEAVRAIRDAVDETAESDSDMPELRMSLGLALHRRYAARGGLSDLHEADWVLGAAARAAGDPEVAVACWQLRALVAEEQAKRTTTSARWHEAGDYYRRAAETAGEAGLTGLEAASRRRRAPLLERTAGPARALEEYRMALRLFEAAGGGDSADADAVRAAVHRIEAGDV
ncbi:SAV_2336 N-terminal domain-related protein [Streptomyces spiramyceticus]|uniref:SAV_2336 N-terminal domain-related protein n=1 Tax=Streptomyces spiramyceticus TaxID=299717 RepID=UPI00237BDCE4|nr:SAV_2336 N-terminal domain-related protein [Streptomyces spiramyceticus]